MQNRIDRLEGLVLSLMTNGAQSAGPVAAARALSTSTSSGSKGFSPQFDNNEDEMVKDENGEEEGESETDRVAQSLGVLHVHSNKSMYVGEAHWAAILNDISEVKNYFTEHKKQYEEQAFKVNAAKNPAGVYTGPAFLFGGKSVPQLQELLTSLPGRDAADKMIARYFNDYDPAIHILHPPSWRRTYEKHWQDPSKTDPVWLGQLYAIFCLAMHSYHRAEDEPFEYKGRTLSLASNYRALTAQCLLLADYTKPVTYILETMVLHLHGEFARSRDAEVGVWVLVGMIVRLAMRMGFHRDPKYYPNLTPFQGEMRRRVWTFVRQSDLLFSFQLGLPSMIRLGDCDTGLPRNIFDDEFDEDIKVLPPSRPMTTPTPVSYMIAKAHLAFTFGKIVEGLHAIQSSSYEEIMKLDQDYREAYANIPQHLRLECLEDSLLDPVATLMMRFNLSILYNKGQCVLHRRFLSRARDNPRYAHSRRTCVDSSMQLLSHQATLHYESRPGRRLHSMKWYINSLTTHDFLLAATLVCLDLWYTAEAEVIGQCSGDFQVWGLERRAEMIRALEVSREIWLELRNQSMEAFKAGEILGVMLLKIQQMHSQATNLKTQNPFQFHNGVTQFTPPEDEKPEHSAALTLGMLSSGGVTPNQGHGFNANYPPTPGTNNQLVDMQPRALSPFTMDQLANGFPSAPSPFSFLTNGNGALDVPPTNLDWEAWDSYIQNNPLDPANEIWPTTMDIPMPNSDDHEQQEQQRQSHQTNGYNAMAGVFMGVSTPPGNVAM
ncbi:hypothetical protein MMC11_000557 [Xylographa trunciseda]|nr:hypothetical protein [Xylographa trunciseda]